MLTHGFSHNPRLAANYAAPTVAERHLPVFDRRKPVREAMVSQQVCARLKSVLRDEFQCAFDHDLDQTLDIRGRELWVIGIDSKQKQCRLTDVCGTIGKTQMDAINAIPFENTDAGFRADAHKWIPTNGKKVDVFLLNTEHFNKPDGVLVPLVVHELAHYLEQIGEKPKPSAADMANAGAILVSLKSNVRPFHATEWAQFLAIGARNVVKGVSTHKTIRKFLEAAIPWYDRNGSISVRE